VRAAWHELPGAGRARIHNGKSTAVVDRFEWHCGIKFDERKTFAYRATRAPCTSYDSMTDSKFTAKHRQMLNGPEIGGFLPAGEH
jgi:hypothetical protein